MFQILADAVTREAVLIDSVHEKFERDMRLLEQLQLKLVTTVDTHVHADHITGKVGHATSQNHTLTISHANI